MPVNSKNNLKYLEPDKDLTGKIFHRYYGDELTWNVFAKPIKRTKKGWICRELHIITDGKEASHDGGKAHASKNIVKGKKPFLISKHYSYHSNKLSDAFCYSGGTFWKLVNEIESFHEQHYCSQGPYF